MNARPEPPWHDVKTVIEALAMVEDVAHNNGWHEPRRPAWSATQVGEAERRLGVALPADLAMLALWYDPVCWGWFQAQPEDDEPDRRQAVPEDQVVRVHDPDEWRVDDKDPPINADLCLREFFIEHCKPGGTFPAEWRQCRFIRFGSTIWLDSLLLCVNGPADAIGRVGMTIVDDAQVLFPARSLRRWLAMLASTGLHDLALTKPPPEFLESEHGVLAVEEFNVLNPHCNWCC